MAAMSDQRPAADAPTNAPRSRVCFIGATGRSGSTLVSRVLGALPGACSVGELCWVWTYGVLRNRPCGCGRPFLDCPFWSEVGSRAYGGWGDVDPARANDLRRRVTRNRRVPQLLGRPLPATAADIEDYLTLLAPLYAAITAASGADVIIDNSKQPEVALLARRTPAVDLSVLHLVRRSHGVAYSWTKHVARADKAGREMLRRPPTRTAAAWLVDNALFEVMGRTGTPRLQMRYEDFVQDPRGSTRAVVDFLALTVSEADMPFVGQDAVVLGADHSVWGNPMRLQTDAIPLRPDEAWRSGLPARDRRLVSAISWPGLLRYGYLR